MKCPCYVSEDPCEIRCSGICGKSAGNSFRNKKEKEQFQYDFCNDGLWWNCELYRDVSGDQDGSMGYRKGVRS